MASGRFSSSVYNGAGIGYRRYVEVVWSSTNDVTNNKSTITWTAYVRSPDPSTTAWVNAKNIVVTINGTSTTLIGSTATATYKNGKLGGDSITITHGSNGKKSVDVSITAQFHYYGTTNSSYSGSISMTPNPVYTLNISAGTGSSITVNRTASTAGGTGNLSAGNKKLYHGDTLKITFKPSTNYNIATHTVNGTTFTSGNSYTVSGNVSVVATATPLKSLVGATDANIGSTTTITITRYNSSYTHTITYTFGNLSGTIATKTSNTSIAWTVPTEFYTQTPNNSSRTCTITCTTYNGNTSLGSSTCTFTATVANNANKPTVVGTIVDTNATTIALTGDSSVLIKNKSTALCTLTATPKNSATISSVKIGGVTVTGATSSGVVTATKTYTGVTATSFEFYAKDSRSYENSITITPTMVNYISLTCNPTIYRDTPTGNTILMDVSGNFYKGSFGAYSNTLTLQYRYKESDGSYGSWITIDTSAITKGTSSYRSTSTLSLQPYPIANEDGGEVYSGFDYHTNYVFQVKATDGAGGYTLSTVTKTVSVARGIPIFDWGENDFNLNVPLMLNNVNILNIVFPIGSVYIHSNNTLPEIISKIGKWTSVATTVEDTYAWKRVT